VRFAKIAFPSSVFSGISEAKFSKDLHLRGKIPSLGFGTRTRTRDFKQKITKETKILLRPRQNNFVLFGQSQSDVTVKRAGTVAAIK